MSQVLLKVEDLQTHIFAKRGVVRAVDGVSFTVREGETLGLIGESGSGKTMTALSLLRLIPPGGRIIGGKVQLEGRDLLSLSDKEMREVRGRMISMILQDPMASLNPVLTVGEQVAEPIRQHQSLRGNAVWDGVRWALRMLQIPSPETRMKSYPHQLSGGMRQRVVGAIAISCQPKLLIADEPTTALDATVQLQFLALLKDVQKRTGVAILFITHDFGIVAKMCDHVAIMYAGKIVETADVRRIFSSPKHPYTVGLLSSIPRLDRKADRLYCIEGQPPTLLNPTGGCRFAPRCAEAFGPCREDHPPQRMIAEGHHVSCWRFV